MLQEKMVGGKHLIGEKKAIDTNQYTILAFNIPGNGFDGYVIDDYKSFYCKRHCKTVFNRISRELKITQLICN